MTLKQAFTSWSLVPANIVLSAKSRDAVNKVLMKKYADVSLEDFSFAFVKRIVSKSPESKELNAKAISILIHILKWGNKLGYCNYPEFDINVSSEDDTGTDKQDNNEEVRQEKKSIMKEPIRVCQIDPDTLNIVNTYDSISAAERAVGVKNIGRTVKKKTLAVGYYWAYEQDAASFSPSKRNTKKKSVQKKDGPRESAANKCENMCFDLTMLSDDFIIKEMRRRGFKGQITKTIEL